MDRVKKAARIFRMWLLLLRSPLQFTVRELAAKYDVNIRTIYRDLSEVITTQKDGSLVMSLQVMDTVELDAWILGWGSHVEVLEPHEKRQAVADTARAVLINYGQKLPL